MPARRTLALLVVVATGAAYPRSAWAQRLQLELRPRVGDTLRMRLDQLTEINGIRRARDGSSVTSYVATRLRMFSRAIVESSGVETSTILAITDSVDVTSNDERTRVYAEQTQRQLEGRRMRLRLAPDGTVDVAEATTVPREVNDLISVMPASFPREAVMVGDMWVREMPLPPAVRLGVPPGGVVRASFRLDSVAPGGELAYLSMRGTLEHPALAGVPADRAMSGSLSGSMVVNRRRGWLAESRFFVEMRTTVAAPSRAATGTAKDSVAPAPMQVQLKITQHMRVFETK